MQLLPRFVSLFALLCIVFLCYGIVGVELFARKFSELLVRAVAISARACVPPLTPRPRGLAGAQQDSAPPSNFDSLADAFTCLFQLMTGQNGCGLAFAVAPCADSASVGPPARPRSADIIYAGIKVKRDMTVAWYFFIYIMFVTLLFVNIFVGAGPARLRVGQWQLAAPLTFCAPGGSAGLVLEAFTEFVKEQDNERKIERQIKQLNEEVRGRCRRCRRRCPARRPSWLNSVCMSAAGPEARQVNRQPSLQQVGVQRRGQRAGAPGHLPAHRFFRACRPPPPAPRRAAQRAR